MKILCEADEFRRVIKSIQMYFDHNRSQKYDELLINRNDIQVHGIKSDVRSMGSQALYEFISDQLSEDVEETAENLKANFTDRQLRKIIQLIQPEQSS